MSLMKYQWGFLLCSGNKALKNPYTLAEWGAGIICHPNLAVYSHQEISARVISAAANQMSLISWEHTILKTTSDSYACHLKGVCQTEGLILISTFYLLRKYETYALFFGTFIFSWMIGNG